MEGSGVDTSHFALLTASKVIGYKCIDENTEYIKCKQAESDPAKCMSQGQKVMNCTLGVLATAQTKCQESYSKYKSCLRDNNKQYRRCRKEEAAFEECMEAAK